VKKFLIPFFLLGISAASANWEYNPGYTDNTDRFVVSVKGGMAMPSASMKNDLGSLIIPYYQDGSGNIYTEYDAAYTFLGTVDIGELSVSEKYKDTAWVGSASVGFIPGHNQNFRMELDWLHIAQSSFSANPLFSGQTEMTAGTAENSVASAKGTATTDIISAMFYYDIFDGVTKPEKTLVPYLGLGIGYATSQTTLYLNDAYGDLSNNVFLGQFGDDSSGILDFYTSETTTNNFAASVAGGLSYGIDKNMFFDFGARASYVPKIRWALNNEADTTATSYQEKDVFSANNVIFLTVYAGVRFEF
jgi:hypothetical protein